MRSVETFLQGRPRDHGVMGVQQDRPAQHFSEKKWPATQFRADETAVTGGETAAAAGQCPQCHLGGYEGDSRVPRLKGQTPTYLLKTMQAFKLKTRKNSPAKSSLLESYSDRDIENMAKYLGDL